jgi:hypothetical protein
MQFLSETLYTVSAEFDVGIFGQETSGRKRCRSGIAGERQPEQGWLSGGCIKFFLQEPGAERASR